MARRAEPRTFWARKHGVAALRAGSSNGVGLRLKSETVITDVCCTRLSPPPDKLGGRSSPGYPNLGGADPHFPRQTWDPRGTGVLMGVA